jgi:preprotein translocase SecF subunit
LGAYGVWMAISETVQVDTIFIIALLTIMWYCINDTIVIFDRIRENLVSKKSSKDMIYGEVFEKSIRDSLQRSIATSISTILVVICMFIFGTWVIKTFSFTIWIWVIFGTFASIFLAAPIAYLLTWKYNKEKGKF